MTVSLVHSNPDVQVATAPCGCTATEIKRSLIERVACVALSVVLGMASATAAVASAVNPVMILPSALFAASALGCALAAFGNKTVRTYCANHRALSVWARPTVVVNSPVVVRRPWYSSWVPSGWRRPVRVVHHHRPTPRVIHHRPRLAPRVVHQHRTPVRRPAVAAPVARPHAAPVRPVARGNAAHAAIGARR